MRRIYRVILTVDIEVDLEEDQYDEAWLNVEEELERPEYWDVAYEAFGWADCSYAELDSYVTD